ncbi:MAG: sulfotransferase family 2 domain-containing protein [bacterium]|nr:sulfotransferase family 2 domain-containing protein [bacterium]
MIAIVIPYYKKKFLKKTLDSLANQTDKRFRVYIGDDASLENIDDLIAEYSYKFNLKYKRFEKNLGSISLTQQWRRCIELSLDEEWILILGDDDYFSLNLIESFYRDEVKFRGKVNVVRFARQNIFSDKDISTPVQYNPEFETAADSYYRRITGLTTSTLSEYAFTRNAYEKSGFYDYPLAWQSDNRAWLEFSDNKPIYSINDSVVNVIRSYQSITGSDLYADEKRKANLSFYKYLIIQKLDLFKKHQAIRVLQKYENEIRHRENITFKLYLFLLPYYIKNYNHRVFNHFFKKIIKCLLPKNLETRLVILRKRKRQLKQYNPSKDLSPKFESSLAPLDYYKCIFVHIPKNAGLSVCYALFGNTGGSHRKIVDYKKIFSPKTFKTYYKFTFVRNPWDRLVSTFFFLKNGGLTEKDKIWAEKHIMSYDTFDAFVREWLTEENITNSLHFQHQHVFLEDEKGTIAVDFIGRFENIDEDFKTITEKLKINRILKKTNTSDRKKDYKVYYNEETKAIVAAIYEKDINLFDYKFSK